MRQVEYDNPGKVYVSVQVNFDEAGQMKPLSFIWEDGQRYEIDHVLDVRRAASTKAGGIGLRFLCSIMGKTVPLFFEDPRWFMVRK